MKPKLYYRISIKLGGQIMYFTGSGILKLGHSLYCSNIEKARVFLTESKAVETLETLDQASAEIITSTEL